MNLSELMEMEKLLISNQQSFLFQWKIEFPFCLPFFVVALYHILVHRSGSWYNPDRRNTDTTKRRQLNTTKQRHNKTSNDNVVSVNCRSLIEMWEHLNNVVSEMIYNVSFCLASHFECITILLSGTTFHNRSEIKGGKRSKPFASICNFVT